MFTTDLIYLYTDFSAARVPQTTGQYQPIVPPSYSSHLMNGITQQPLTKQGVVGGAVPQHGTVVMGRGLGRGRGRSVMTPARQPNTQPTSVGVGRGIGSLASRSSLCSVYSNCLRSKATSILLLSSDT